MLSIRFPFVVTLALFACLSLSAVAQRKPKPAAAPEPQATQPAAPPATAAEPQPAAREKVDPFIAHFLRKYSLALQFNDYDVAKDALYDVIVEAPTDSLITSLALLYFESQKYTSAFLVAQAMLQRDPKNLTMLEVAAASAESIGVYDRALQFYETHYLLSNSLSTLYKIAFLQFDLKRFAECKTNAEILLSKPDVATMKVIYNDVQNKQKEYPMKVAVLNLVGTLKLEQADKEGARKAFQEALAIAPDFVLARQGMEKAK
jgi:tetratricopeptide (TPR) repeat protein